MADSRLPSIEKLHGSINYDSWKFDLECILIHDNLWKYVENFPNTENKEEVREDQKARTKICLLLENSCKVHVRKAKTAKEAWQALKSAFQDKGINNRCRLLSRLVSLKLRMFDSVTDYVTELMRVANQLHDLGKEVDDELLAALMLQGLPEEYAPLRLALENTNTEITTDFVKTKLLQLDEESTSNTRYANREEQGTALLTPKGKKNKFQRTNYKKKTIKCFICEGSHKACDCPDNPRNRKTTHFATLLSRSQSTGCEEEWILDSGASAHMSNNKEIMRNYSEYKQKVEISCANGDKVFGEGYGMIESDSPVFSADNVMYVPNLSSNLLSVSCIVRKNKVVVFSKKGCEIFDENECSVVGKPSLKGNLDKGIYKLKTAFQASALASTVTEDMELWHRRLAHLGIRNLMLLRDKMATGVSFKNITMSKLDCVACVMGKHIKQPFNKHKASRARELLELVHSDICGPMRDSSFAGFRYFMTFIDDYSRKTFIYFLKNKSEAFEKIRLFKALVENQTGTKLKILRTDNGGEYVNKRLKAYLSEHGIKQQFTIPYTPQQNGVAERANRTIMERARSMIHEAGLSTRYWAEAVNTVVYLKNRSPTMAVKNKTPEELWTGKKVDLSHLKVFGCRAFKHIPSEKRTKLDPKSCELVFVGYCEESKGYRLIDPKDGILHRARDVVFMENQMYRRESKPEQTIIGLDQHDENNDSRLDQEKIDETRETWFDCTQEHEDESEQGVSQNLLQRDAEHIENANSDVTIAEGSSHEQRRYPLRERRPKVFPDFVT